MDLWETDGGMPDDRYWSNDALISGPDKNAHVDSAYRWAKPLYHAGEFRCNRNLWWGTTSCGGPWPWYNGTAVEEWKEVNFNVWWRRVKSGFPNSIAPSSPDDWATLSGIENPIVRAGRSCQWSVSTAISSPQYEWSVDGVVLGTGSTFNYTPGYGQSSYFLQVAVYNNDGPHWATSSKTVTVTDDAELCYIE